MLDAELRPLAGSRGRGWPAAAELEQAGLGAELPAPGSGDRGVADRRPNDVMTARPLKDDRLDQLAETRQRRPVRELRRRAEPRLRHHRMVGDPALAGEHRTRPSKVATRARRAASTCAASGRTRTRAARSTTASQRPRPPWTGTAGRRWLPDHRQRDRRRQRRRGLRCRAGWHPGIRAGRHAARGGEGGCRLAAAGSASGCWRRCTGSRRSCRPAGPTGSSSRSTRPGRLPQVAHPVVGAGTQRDHRRLTAQVTGPTGSAGTSATRPMAY